MGFLSLFCASKSSFRLIFENRGGGRPKNPMPQRLNMGGGLIAPKFLRIIPMATGIRPHINLPDNGADTLLMVLASCHLDLFGS
jgi:hypothetical protein